MLMEARLLDERREGIAECEANANIAAKRLFSMGLISPRLLLSHLNKLKRCKLSSNHKLKLIL